MKKKILIILAMALACNPAFAFYQVLCAGGSGWTNYYLKCDYGTTATDYTRVFDIFTTCTRNNKPPWESGILWQTRTHVYSYPVTWHNSINIGCMTGIFPWWTYAQLNFQTNMYPRFTSVPDVYERRTDTASLYRGRAGLGCPNAY